MSQHKTFIKADKQHQHQERIAQRQDVVKNTAAVFTCSTDIAHDFAHQCADQGANVEADIAFTRVAHQIWHGRPGPAVELVRAFVDLLAERQRHFDSLTELGSRFQALATNPSFQHQHLDPPDAYVELIRNQLFPD